MRSHWRAGGQQIPHAYCFHFLSNHFFLKLLAFASTTFMIPVSLRLPMICLLPSPSLFTYMFCCSWSHPVSLDSLAIPPLWILLLYIMVIGFLFSPIVSSYSSIPCGPQTKCFASHLWELISFSNSGSYCWPYPLFLAPYQRPQMPSEHNHLEVSPSFHTYV